MQEFCLFPGDDAGPVWEKGRRSRGSRPGVLEGKVRLMAGRCRESRPDVSPSGYTAAPNLLTGGDGEDEPAVRGRKGEGHG